MTKLSLESQITERTPLCAGPDPYPRRPKIPLPPGSCDCHAHICGPADTYRYADSRIYTPPDAPVPDYLAMLRTLGVERAVIIQPSAYGTDNTVTLKALETPDFDLRGVAVVDRATITDAELARMNDAGIQGVRINLVDVADPSAALPLDSVRDLADRIAPFGWHVEFLMHVDDRPDLDTVFADFPTDIVFGHLGYMRPDRDPSEPGFQALLRLMEKGRCWVKLTAPYRITAGNLPYPNVVPTARALVEAAPDRLLWGSDWPHVMVTRPMPNDGDLCDLLAGWIPDAHIRKKVLVDNPARLYGF
jgi:predicted TIM-barrel fold metal-dependent hydrolase